MLNNTTYISVSKQLLSFDNCCSLLCRICRRKVRKTFPHIKSLRGRHNAVSTRRTQLQLSVWGRQQLGEYSDDYVNDHNQTGCLYLAFPCVRRFWSIAHISLSHNVHTCPTIFTWSRCSSHYCLLLFSVRHRVSLTLKFRSSVFIILSGN